MKRAIFQAGSALAFTVFVLTSLHAQSTTQPDQHQTLSTRSVDCLSNAQGQPIASQTARTPIFTSADGSRAYGVVTAEYRSSGSCENISQIYFADVDGSLRVLFRQGEESLPDGTVYDGNGVEAIRWSPSGTRLLLEVSQWTWGTDSTWNTKYILFTKGQPEPRQLAPEETIGQHFTQPCLRTIESLGWTDDTHVAFNVNASREYDEEGTPDSTPSCVDKPTRFTFDVTTQPLQSAK
jgi:hypothetical protein